jgi:ABC-type transport system involved in multi-copper enzyme maturation permease subunit/stalled ribosome alternative rescue factor ArfA
MIRDLIVKEFRDHVLSLRFQVGLALALVLISVSAFVLSTGYRRAAVEYFERQHQEDAFLRQYSHLNRLGVMVRAARPPSSFVLVRGLAQDAGTESLTANPLPEMFPPMDLAVIVALVFSLLGIVLGYDAVNGEKEQGTLRLILANRVPRAAVLVAKWASGLVVLALALLASLLAGVLIVLLRAGVEWTANEWCSVAAVFGASLLYCGAFFSLALALSVLWTRSSVSVLSSLLAWALFVLVLPNLSPYLAAQVRRVPAVAAIERDIQYLTSEKRDELGRAESMKVRAKYGMSRGDVEDEAVQRRIATDPEFRARYEQFRKDIDGVWDRVNAHQQVEADRLRNDWQARARSQFDLSRTFSYASPLPPLLYALTDLSATGFDAFQDFGDQAGAYSRGLWEYARARFQAEQRTNPALDVNDFLDMSSRPRFAYVPPRWPHRLTLALGSFEALAAWNLAFLAAAVMLFGRFDVR